MMTQHEENGAMLEAYKEDKLSDLSCREIIIH